MSFRRKITQLIVCAMVFVFYVQFQLFSYTQKRLFLKRIKLSLSFSKDYTAEQQPDKICSYQTLANSGRSSKGLTLMTWTSPHIKDLRSFLDFPVFPKHPVSVQFDTKVSLRLHSSSSTGGWLFGALHVPETGDYRFAVSSSGESQLRLSRDDEPENYRAIASVLSTAVEDLPASGQYDKHPSQTSVSVVLHKCRTYFIEVLFHNAQENGHVEIAWETPNSLNYVAIPAVFLSPYMTAEDIGYSGENLLIFEDSVKMGALFWHLVREKHSVESEELRLPFMTSQHAARLLPQCSPDFKGHTSGSLLEIPRINSKTTSRFIDDYKNRLVTANKGKYSFIGMDYSEEKMVDSQGRRYLMNLVFADNMMDMKVRVSEYLFYENDKQELCVVKGFKWKRDAMVTVIAIIREMEIWSHYFVDHLSEMTTKLQDARFSVIIVASKQMKGYFQTVVSQNTLAWHSRVTLLLLSAREVQSVDEILKAVTSHIKVPNTIMFFTDIRVQMPTKILEHVRKRTIEGRTIFIPWPENFEKGFYENATVVNPLDHAQNDHPPSVALYVSDWKRLNDQKVVARRNVGKSMNKGNWWDIIKNGALEIYVSKIPKYFYYQ